MGKVYPRIDSKIADWVGEQKMFFVSTAPLASEGLINSSPKGMDSFRIIDEHTVAYLDLTGSGVETIAHLKENGRITIMLCAFDGGPKIVRFYGKGEVFEKGSEEYQGMIELFEEYPGARSIIRIAVEWISDACGYSVPLYSYEGERDILLKWAENKGEEGVISYQQEKNSRSIDGLEGVGSNTHDLAFLHTTEVHVKTFSDLLQKTGEHLSVRHEVDESLLSDALSHGMTQDLEARIHAAMRAAASTGARVVVCSCSTIGGIAERSGEGESFISSRIDRAMADQAVRGNKRILVVAALESTLQPTRELIEDSAAQAGVSPEIVFLHVSDAWAHFESGDLGRYHEVLAVAIQQECSGYDVIVLAQASMAPAAELCDDLIIPILSSPSTGLSAALESVNK